MIVAAFDTTVTITTIVAVISITGGAVAAFLRLRGDTRQAIEGAADRRVEEARESLNQMATISREWREQWQAGEDLRIKERQASQEEKAALRDQLDKCRTELGVALTATDLSGLEARLNLRFDAFLHAQEQNTAVLAQLIETTSGLAAIVNPSAQKT